MALWFTLKVNDERVGTFYAQRRESKIPDDFVCTYDITVVDPDGDRRAVIRHDYRHSAFTLVQAALAATSDPDRHVYLSSACLHAREPGREGLHLYCQTDAVRYDGTDKIAASCKFCQPPGSGHCICTCHVGGLTDGA